MDDSQREQAKRAAGVAAAALIQPDMLVGLGTGSTTRFFIEALCQRIEEGLSVDCVATSHHSEELARSLSIPMRPIESVTQVDLTVDGADCIDPKKQMIKGGGGALLREKILAASSREMVVIVDSDKWQERLEGDIPLEIVPFAHKTTLERLKIAGFECKLRMNKEFPYVTDNGHYIALCPMGSAVQEIPALHLQLKAIIGVVETGLFFNVAGRVLVGFADGHVEVR
jgi:ribose 5-phosphate isomerase A